ncbi:MAG: pyridoxine 5'-phosphate synthase [Proteobacteria bacterium]|nr:pyridoxine 5'-phosphate synthase [Pseudomonadota bacterium]
MVKLGVNIDHVATLREARKINYPDPVYAAVLAELGGCDGITVHLREDRRHIKERDLYLLKDTIKTRLNLEMSTNEEIVKIALKVKPDMVTLVPEKRQELTTEGGLDVVKNKKKITEVVETLKKAGIEVFIFIDADRKQIETAKKIGAEGIEIHTGRYAEARTKKELEKEFLKIKEAVQFSLDMDLITSAGHGLNYHNVRKIADIPGLYELNIGHSIISYALYVGMERAVRDMVNIIRG